MDSVWVLVGGRNYESPHLRRVFTSLGNAEEWVKRNLAVDLDLVADNLVEGIWHVRSEVKGVWEDVDYVHGLDYATVVREPLDRGD